VSFYGDLHTTTSCSALAQPGKVSASREATGESGSQGEPAQGGKALSLTKGETLRGWRPRLWHHRWAFTGMWTAKDGRKVSPYREMPALAPERRADAGTSLHCARCKVSSFGERTSCTCWKWASTGTG